MNSYKQIDWSAVGLALAKHMTLKQASVRCECTISHLESAFKPGREPKVSTGLMLLDMLLENGEHLPSFHIETKTRSLRDLPNDTRHMNVVRNFLSEEESRKGVTLREIFRYLVGDKMNQIEVQKAVNNLVELDECEQGRVLKLQSTNGSKTLYKLVEPGCYIPTCEDFQGVHA